MVRDDGAGLARAGVVQSRIRKPCRTPRRAVATDAARPGPDNPRRLQPGRLDELRARARRRPPRAGGDPRDVRVHAGRRRVGAERGGPVEHARADLPRHQRSGARRRLCPASARPAAGGRTRRSNITSHRPPTTSTRARCRASPIGSRLPSIGDGQRGGDLRAVANARRQVRRDLQGRTGAGARADRDR